MRSAVTGQAYDTFYITKSSCSREHRYERRVLENGC